MLFTFRSCLDSLGLLEVWISILNLQITLKLMTQGYIYYKLRKTFETCFSLGHTLNFCPNLIKYRLKKMFFVGIFHLFSYSDLFYKPLATRNVIGHSEFHFIRLENSYMPSTSSSVFMT